MSLPLVSFEPSHSYEQAIGRAASLWGIQPGYWDIFGNYHATSAEVACGILRSLGVPCGSREELDQAIEERLWKEWSRALPPTIVVSENASPRETEIHVPAECSAAEARIQIFCEDGLKHDATAPLASLRDSGRAELRGRRFLKKQLPLPARLPLGYHRMDVAAGGLWGSARLIVCPERTYVPEELGNDSRWGGLAVSLYGLRSSRNWGCGDFTDLEELTDWFESDVGGAFIGLNPLHAIANRQPYNTSPYLPNCSFFRNFIYLDIERLEDFAKTPRARARFHCADVQQEIRALREAPYVEYERVAALKLGFLKLLFARFLREEYRRDTRRAWQFREYIQSEGHLLDRFAVYCALDEWIRRRFPGVWVWTEWPPEYQDPDSEATQAFTRARWRSVLLYKYIQWQVELQLEAVQQYARRHGLPIGLYHDLALATDRFGSDLWAHRPYYVAGCRVGAPPDDFSPNGQDWSFPPPNAERHHEDGYELFADSIRQNCRHGGALRIDHVMRFFHLFWIPDGMPASRGAYVNDYAEDLLHILALESVRNKVMVIGEDLGTVADHVREALHRFGILTYRLLYFEKDRGQQFKLPEQYPRRALVSVSTHDLPTLAGFWVHADIEARRAAGLLGDERVYLAQKADREKEKQKMLDAFFRLGLLPAWFPRSAAGLPELTGELHSAAVAFLAATPSKLMALNQEDLFKDPEQQNLPGSTHQYPNWRHKMRFSLEELRRDALARAFAAMYRECLRRSGRAAVSKVRV